MISWTSPSIIGRVLIAACMVHLLISARAKLPRQGPRLIVCIRIGLDETVVPQRAGETHGGAKTEGGADCCAGIASRGAGGASDDFLRALINRTESVVPQVKSRFNVATSARLAKQQR